MGLAQRRGRMNMPSEAMTWLNPATNAIIIEVVLIAILTAMRNIRVRRQKHEHFDTRSEDAGRRRGL